MAGWEQFFGNLDPDDLQRRLAEMAEQAQQQQGLAWADNAIGLAVQMTVAAINRVNVQGNAEEQAHQIRALMATVFPEAGPPRRAARAGPPEAGAPPGRVRPAPAAPPCRRRRAP